MLALSHFATGTAGLLAATAWTWCLITEVTVDDPGKPRIKADPVPRLEASLPIIGAFESFNINSENPFIPANLRQIERERLIATPAAPPKKAPPVPVVEKPALPALPPAPAIVPTLQGVMVFNGKAAALVIPPGESDPRWVALGDTAGGWRLKALEGSQAAVWESLDGGPDLRQVVMPSEPASEEDKASDKHADGAKPGTGKAPAKPAIEAPVKKAAPGTADKTKPEKAKVDKTKPEKTKTGKTQPNAHPPTQAPPPPEPKPQEHE